MTIEVRQLVIKATVGEAPLRPTAAAQEMAGGWLERLREDLLAECEILVDEKLQRARER
jgi:hypothetical protein